MGNPFDEIKQMRGLWTHGNPLTAPDGAMLVADEAEILREDMVQRRRGYRDMSGNLPDFLPDQLLSVGNQAFLNLDSGLWYFDTTSSTWLRKRGALGAKSISPRFMTILNGVLYYTAVGTCCIGAINLTTGEHSIIAGRLGVAGTTDATGDAARFSTMTTGGGITNDGTNLYVCDSGNNTIRKVAAPLTVGAGVVTTIAGTAGSALFADGTGAVARFATTAGITFDGTNLYVCDSNVAIRKLAPPLTAGAAVVTTIAGLGGTPGTADGTGTAARFTNPRGITFAGTNLYMTEANNVVRRLAPPLTAGAAVVTTIAGTAGSSGSADGTGAAARFAGPQGIASDGTNLYVCDNSNNNIRKLAPPLTVGAAVVTTPYGSLLTALGNVDGIGNAALFEQPYDVKYDAASNALYVCETFNVIRKIYLATGYVSQIFGAYLSPAVSVFGAGAADGIVQGPT